MYKGKSVAVLVLLSSLSFQYFICRRTPAVGKACVWRYVIGNVCGRQISSRQAFRVGSFVTPSGAFVSGCPFRCDACGRTAERRYGEKADSRSHRYEKYVCMLSLISFGTFFVFCLLSLFLSQIVKLSNCQIYVILWYHNRSRSVSLYRSFPSDSD